FLAASMMAAYEEAVSSPACVFSYQATDGREIKLNYSDVITRLFKFSFDPYHCAELRWGATSAAELAACRDTSDSDKMSWYKAEQKLRNQTDRTYDLKMDFDAAGTTSLGANAPPDVDLWSYLAAQLKPSNVMF
ncbi:MAG: hypothetical protein ACXVA9_06285, partial [Bdellovibrionales bacterium]